MQRSAFLARLRTQLGAEQGSRPAPVPRPRLQRAPLDDARRASLFAERLTALGVIVAETATLSAARQDVERLCAARDWRRIACAPSLCWPGIRPMWVEEAKEAPFGLSSAASAIAATGTVVLRHGGEARRGYSLLPPAAGFFVYRSDIVDCLGDVLRALDAETTGLPPCITFVSGPSTTADIAGVRCTGVHGPGEVFVWVIASTD
jgi:L-lactate utilization protein LutC